MGCWLEYPLESMLLISLLLLLFAFSHDTNVVLRSSAYTVSCYVLKSQNHLSVLSQNRLSVLLRTPLSTL